MRLRPSRLPPVAPGSYPVALFGFVWRAPGLPLACSGLLWPTLAYYVVLWPALSGLRCPVLPCSASVLVRPGPPCPVKPGSIVEQPLGDGGRGNETLPNETCTSSPAGRAQPILSWLGPVASGGSSSSQIRPHHDDESTVQCIGIVHQGLLASLRCPSAMRQRPCGQ